MCPVAIILDSTHIQHLLWKVLLGIPDKMLILVKMQCSSGNQIQANKIQENKSSHGRNFVLLLVNTIRMGGYRCENENNNLFPYKFSRIKCLEGS